MASAADDERKLVLLAMVGDEDAFQKLVLRHQARLRALLRRGAGDPALADDIAQTVFVKAWQNIADLRDAGAFRAWLMRIAARAAIDAQRKGAPYSINLDEDIHGDDRASAASATEARLDIEAALDRLKPQTRLCVLLFHGEGLSHGDIAAETGMPIGTVKSHIARGTALLRSLLSDWRTYDG